MLDDCLGVVVGDVSSHGMGPALLMSETRAYLRTLAQIHGDVGEILTRANRLLAADASDFHFVTLAMARLDPQRPVDGLRQRGPAGLSAPVGHRDHRSWTAPACRWASATTRWCRPPRRSRSSPANC